LPNSSREEYMDILAMSMAMAVADACMYASLDACFFTLLYHCSIHSAVEPFVIRQIRLPSSFAFSSSIVLYTPKCFLFSIKQKNERSTASHCRRIILRIIESNLSQVLAPMIWRNLPLTCFSFCPFRSRMKMMGACGESPLQTTIEL
jgi:hypothetical protein